MLPKWSPEVYLRAWNFAAVAHADQTYGGTAEGERIPYIAHITSVATEVVWALAQEELRDTSLDGDLAIQCALLHDVIEDTPYGYADVEREFGPAVADGVAALTKSTLLPSKTAQMGDSLTRIQAQPREVWLVKLADRISNLAAPPFYWDNDKILAYQVEARQIHTALASAHGSLAQRLAERIERYPGYLRP